MSDLRKHWDERIDGDFPELVEIVLPENRKLNCVSCSRKSCNPIRWYGQGWDNLKSQTWTSSLLGLANRGVGVEINW